MRYYRLLLLISILSFAIVSCKPNKENENLGNTKSNETKEQVKRVKVLKVISPKSGELFTVGDKVYVSLEKINTDNKVDSIVFDSYGTKYNNSLTAESFSWDTKDLKAGRNKLKIAAYSKGNKIDSYTLNLRFKSDIVPEKYQCKIVKTYDHSTNDYTQGLIYEDGIMYEGTGQHGKSVLKKIDFKTGNLIAELSLPQEYFGEGVTIYKDKIIQLTWRSRKGFVYDKKTFKLINTLDYPTQGWGLTNDDKRLIMSDGSETIHFLDPEYFSEIGKQEIFNHEGAIESLNELELIDGLVYANVYQTNTIVAFDPETGKVLKEIDCSNVVPEGFEDEYDLVLNGIAYDKAGDRIFITGKRWPKLYEVKFIKQ